MSNIDCQQNSGWTLGDELTPAEQAAWSRLSEAEAELSAARWAVIETTNRESRNRRAASQAKEVSSRSARTA
jgi:hypothetical protein